MTESAIITGLIVAGILFLAMGAAGTLLLIAVIDLCSGQKAVAKRHGGASAVCAAIAVVCWLFIR